MPWSPADAQGHTGLANTASRQKLWARTANEILAATGDEGKAVRIANSAVHKDVNRSVDRRVARSRDRGVVRLI